MPENLNRVLDGLEQELRYAKQADDSSQAAAIKKEIASTKRRLKKAGEVAEAAVESPGETPEDKPDEE